MDRKLLAQLNALKADLEGPLGQIPLDRAIRAHLALFNSLRKAGCTWGQIANALAAVDIRKPDGRVWSADHLRGAVARQTRRNIGARAEGKTQPSAIASEQVSVEKEKTADVPPAVKNPGSLHNRLARAKIMRTT